MKMPCNSLLFLSPAQRKRPDILTLRGRLRFWIFDFALLDLSLARN
jgi:hypothetical protein